VSLFVIYIRLNSLGLVLKFFVGVISKWIYIDRQRLYLNLVVLIKW